MRSPKTTSWCATTPGSFEVQSEPAQLCVDLNDDDRTGLRRHLRMLTVSSALLLCLPASVLPLVSSIDTRLDAALVCTLLLLASFAPLLLILRTRQTYGDLQRNKKILLRGCVERLVWSIAWRRKASPGVMIGGVAFHAPLIAMPCDIRTGNLIEVAYFPGSGRTLRVSKV